jgi:hypothetical protein
VAAVRRGGGKLLEKKKGSTDIWIELTDDKIISSKVMQAFRDRRRKRAVATNTSDEGFSDVEESNLLESRMAQLEAQVLSLELENKVLKTRLGSFINEFEHF